MKIAIVHDYLYTQGGGERVLDMLHELYPDAPVYTIIYDKNAVNAEYRNWDIRPSFVNILPFRRKLLKYYVPFMPMAVEKWDFSGYDAVISVSAGFGKGIITPINTCHISYTLTVPRFLWGYETSTQAMHNKNIFLPFVNNYLRIWDKSASDRVDYFLANSATVQRRIFKSYGRQSRVIYSPVDDEQYSLSTIPREDFYLIVSRLESYKHIDMAVRVCVAHGLKLKIIGEGPQREALEKIAQGHVDFLGRVPDDVALRFFKSAKAIIFPGADDLGLVPIEAQMCGTPVIALRKDGAVETVPEGIGGILYDEMSEEGLFNAIQQLDHMQFDSQKMREYAMRFSKKKVKAEMRTFIAECVSKYAESYSLH